MKTPKTPNACRRTRWRHQPLRFPGRGDRPQYLLFAISLRVCKNMQHSAGKRPLARYLESCSSSDESKSQSQSLLATSKPKYNQPNPTLSTRRNLQEELLESMGNKKNDKSDEFVSSQASTTKEKAAQAQNTKKPSNLPDQSKSNVTKKNVPSASSMEEASNTKKPANLPQHSKSDVNKQDAPASTTEDKAAERTSKPVLKRSVKSTEENLDQQEQKHPRLHQNSVEDEETDLLFAVEDVSENKTLVELHRTLLQTYKEVCEENEVLRRHNLSFQGLLAKLTDADTSKSMPGTSSTTCEPSLHSPGVGARSIKDAGIWEDAGNDRVHIGMGLTISRAEHEHILFYGIGPSKYVRCLAKIIFTEEEFLSGKVRGKSGTSKLDIKKLLPIQASLRQYLEQKQ